MKYQSYFVIILLNVSIVLGQNDDKQKLVLNTDSIIRITFENHPKIKAAQYKLQSADYNFKLFESEFTQFNPLLIDTKIDKNSDDETTGEIAVGMEKEFFDGSSISVYAGNATERISKQMDHSQFVEGKLEFPLFSSNRKLSRIIKRTFEENELYSANLDYVDVIRETIENALEKYYDYVPRKQELDMLILYKNLLEHLLTEQRPIERNNEFRQIQDEIKSLESDIKSKEVSINSYKIQLQRWLGIESIATFTIEPIYYDVNAHDYFGSYYVSESYDTILNRALENDTEIEVLNLVIENAKEKRRLAERGKWDIFVSGSARYNYFKYNDEEISPNGYSVSTGLNIKRFDKNVLNYSIQKANADILNVEAYIEDRKVEIAAEIKEGKEKVQNQQQQMESIYESLTSRKQIYELKLEHYLTGDESVDNLIHVFRSLMDTEEDFYELLNDYFDNIRDLDYLCGVYFEKLGIKVGVK